jgi:hypothetical protein
MGQGLSRLSVRLEQGGREMVLFEGPAGAPLSDALQLLDGLLPVLEEALVMVQGYAEPLQVYRRTPVA